MKWNEMNEMENICPQADREQTLREQSLNSKTEATLILCGSSGERANFQQESFFIRIVNISKAREWKSQWGGILLIYLSLDSGLTLPTQL